MTRKAVVYTRVSTDEQAEKGFSLPSQLAACREYAQRYEYQILAEFSDEFSGREIDRPGLNNMRDFIGSNNVDAVIIYSGDRLSRDLAHSIELRREFSLLQVELFKVMGGPVDDSPQGRFTENVMSAVSQLESEIIVERTQRGKNQRAKSGHIIFQGYPPYGYKKVGVKPNMKYVIDDREALVVKNIYTWFINGKDSTGPMSLRATATHLNKIGAPPPNKSPRSVDFWNPFTVRKILSNEIYAGTTFYGKTRIVNKKRVYQPPERWIAIDVPELAIIDKGTFEAAKRRRERNKQLSKRNRKHTYLLSGFFRCGECGATMVGHTRHYKSGRKAQFYRCGSHWKQFSGAPKCGVKSLDTVAHKYDNAVWDWVKDLLCDTEALEVGLQDIMENRSGDVAAKQGRLMLLKGLMNEEDVKIRRLINEMGNFQDNTILEAIRKEIDQTARNHKALEEEHEKLKEVITQIELMKDQQEHVLEFANKIKHTLEDAGFEEKRRIMDILDVRAAVHYDEKGKWLEICCAIPSQTDVIEFKPLEAKLPGLDRSGK